MRTKQTTLAVFAAFLLVAAGCRTEIDDKPAAEVVSDTAPTETTTAAVDRRLPVDPERSAIRFVGAKVTGQHNGEFHEFDGWVGFSGDQPRQIEFTIETASLQTDTERLDRHLRTSDFFDTANFPQAKFTSTSIETMESTDPEAPSHQITGVLDLHGIQKEIRFPANVGRTEDGLRAISQFTINRKDWSINYPGAPDDLIRDDVLIKLDLLFPETEAEAEEVASR